MNPNDAAKCPACGTAMEPTVAQGLCPKCLWAGGFDTQPASEPAGASAGKGLAVPMPEELGTHFPQFEILQLLGRGGMGWVFKARQRNLDRLVALKILPPVTGSDPAFAERFLREARALARLNHPNIVGVHEFGQAGPYFFLVMEFIDGANLRQLERTRRLAPEEAFSIIPKICEALQFAHDEGIVHRDIKPENILVDSKGRVKIADFGIAKILGRKEDFALTGTQHTLGTPHYMAPEQVETPSRVDHRADIYALGVVFYEMLTGQLPIGHFEPPSKSLRVDVRIDEVVLKSLERDPDRRYQTANAVKTDVQTIAGTDGASTVGVASGGRMAAGVESGAPGGGRSAAATPGVAPRGSGPASGTAGEVLGTAFRDWWAERPKWVAITVQTLLALAHVYCLFSFFSTQLSRREVEGEGVRFVYRVGAGSPWFSFESNPSPGVPFRSGIDFLSSSLWYLVVGFAFCFAIWRIEKARNSNVRWWNTPTPVAILWLVWAVAAVGVGTKLGHEAVQSGIGMRRAVSPQLSSAMEIQAVDARDAALRKVALQAAGVADWITVKAAVEQIGAFELHDQVAAECAGILVGTRIGATHASAAALLIRADTLRDATLALVATSPTPASLSADWPVSGGGRDSAAARFIAAAGRGEVGQMVAALGAGASVNDKNATGQTALILAAVNGHRAVAMTLIVLGADLLEKDREGRTAVMHAVARRDREFLSGLQQLHVLSEFQDPKERRERLMGLPGLDRALLQGRNIDLVNFQAWTESLDQTDAEGETPAVMAARLGDWGLFQTLGRTPAAVRARSRSGRNAAMHFAAAGTTEAFEILRLAESFGQHGVTKGFNYFWAAFDVDQMAMSDKEGRTAIQLAREKGHGELGDLLENHLKSLAANLTREIDRLTTKGLSPAEVAEMAAMEGPSTNVDESARAIRLTASALRKLHQTRSHAWRALGDVVQAEADLKRATGP